MHGVTESRPVTVRMEARPWRSGNKTTEWATKLALTRSAFSWKGRSIRRLRTVTRWRQVFVNRTRVRRRRGLPAPPAPRTAARADGGEILASNVVRELCSGKPFLFADRGEHAMKGFDEAVRVYEISWRS